MIEFQSRNGGQVVVITDAVLKQFEGHKQVSASDHESGGQLFAKFVDGAVVVEEATGLRSGDRRGFHYFWPSRIAERKEIKQKFKSGLNYVGDWHTHPEDNPIPSRVDIENIRDCFNQSRHQLMSFLLIVVGRAIFPDGLSVSIHNNKTSTLMIPVMNRDGVGS